MSNEYYDEVYNKTVNEVLLSHPSYIKSHLLADEIAYIGEEIVSALLETYVEGYFKIMRNIILPIGETATEIDVLMVHEKGIFVIESKNYSGWIFGSETQNKWTQSLPNGDKNQFYNPIKQNNTHCAAIRNVLGVDSCNVISYIVFAERCTLKKVPMSRKGLSIVKRNRLLVEVEKEIDCREDVFTEEEVQLILNRLKQCSNTDELRRKHEKQIKANNI